MGETEINRRIAEMEDALTFYRDGFRFKPKRTRTGIDLSTWEPTEALLDDCGERARAVLSQPMPARGTDND